MKALVLLLLLAGCAGSASNSADANRNRLATVEASYGAAQVVALAYMKRPICGQTRMIVCAAPPVMVQIQNADRAANAAVNRAAAAVKSNPADPSTTQLVIAAADGVENFKKVTPNDPNR
jgi:hypothetical protein